MDDSNAWEALSPDEQEAFGRRVTVDSLARLATARTTFDEWAIHSTSQLAQDNAATALYRTMSVEIHYLLSSAFDHLAVVRRLVDSGSLPPFAPYTLIRSAIESVGFAAWLQIGGTMDSRIIRLLQMQWNQRVSVNSYTSAVGAHTQEYTDWLLEVLTETKTRRGKLKQRDLTIRMPRTTDLLAVVERSMPPPLGLTPLNAWRACSGVTHGNQQFAAGLMSGEREVLLPTGEAATSNTTSLSSLALMLGPAVSFLEQLLQRVIEASQPRSGRPEAAPIVGGPPVPSVLR